MATEPQKKRVFLLCGHEPTLDPRIDWEASYAGHTYDVKVIGFHYPGKSLAPSECAGKYRVERVATPTMHPWIAASVLIKQYLFGRRGWLFWLLVGPIAVTVLPALLIAGWTLLFTVELLWNLLRLLLWPIRSFRSIRIAYAACARAVAWLRRKLRTDRISTVGWYLDYFVRTNYGLVQSLLALPERADVVHCNDLATLLAGVVYRKFTGCRVVYDAHEYWPHSNPEAAPWEVWMFSWYERRLAPKADAAFTVSPQLATRMGKAYRRTFGTVPNTAPLGTSAITPVSSTMADLAGDRVRFLFQGNFVAERGLEELIEIWARASEPHCALFLRGPGNPDRDACIAHADRLGVLDRSVYFLEPVSEADLIAAASEADVGVIPYKPTWVNYRFACPNKLSQYMQAGLAILSNDLDYVRQVLERYSCGRTYQHTDPAGAARIIHELATNSESRKEMAANGRRATQDEFNWEVQSRPLYEAYAALAANRPYVAPRAS